MRALAAGFFLVLATAQEPQTAPKGERLQFNPHERTRSAISDLEAGNIEAGLDKLETASRLAPDDPLTAFNSGTGRLLAGAEDAAVRLEEAAALASAELAPIVQYNLGNARLAKADAAAAIEAYKNVLRADPGHMDAKYNLEVARKLLSEQQQQQQQQNQDDQQQQQDQQDEQQQQDGENDEQQDQQEEQEQQSEQPDPDQQPAEQPPQQRPNPLPDFEKQEDMTAEQAAAILEAVENLEREQRRQEAAERARRRSRTAKDW